MRFILHPPDAGVANFIQVFFSDSIRVLDLRLTRTWIIFMILITGQWLIRFADGQKDVLTPHGIRTKPYGSCLLLGA